MNLAIYSGYTGPGDRTHISYSPTGKYPAYFVSNNAAILDQAKNLGWLPIFLNNPEPVDDWSISTSQCKVIKITPSAHDKLRDYDYLYYTDDKMGVDDSRMEQFVDSLGDNAYALRRHPWNPPNILYELAESLEQKRYYYIREKLFEYISREVGSGHGLNSKIYWCSSVLRNMKHRDRLSIDDDWYESTLASGGLQDQISFFFTAQRYASSIVELPQDCDRHRS